MFQLRTVFWIIAGVGLLPLIALGAEITESPLETIRTTVEQTTAVLKDPAYQGAAQKQARIAQVWKLVRPSFDIQEIAKRALGAHWRNRTQAQRQEFGQLFISLMEQTYSNALDRHTRNAEFSFGGERIEGNFAEVDSRLANPSLDTSFGITYRLHQVGEKWLIYDVVVENVSLVRNYRTQFARIINQSSYEDLVQNLQRKLQQLAASSS